MIPESLKPLIKIDKLRKIEFDQCDSYVHERHRWVLPLIFEYQKMGFLPKPCKLLLFDRHDDGQILSEEALSFIKGTFSNLSTEIVIEICTKYLNPQNDDWIKAGMEMGIFSNIIAFGVDQNERWFNEGSYQNKNYYKDQNGIVHFMIYLGHPGDEVHDRGFFGDLCKKNESIEQVWKELNWDYDKEKGFFFNSNSEKLVIDIDLDCFTIYWGDYIFPWIEEVYIDRYKREKSSNVPKLWCGFKFFQGLINQSGLITIAREKSFCGGNKKANIILNDINKYLFDNKLQL